jgi:hypothetical protein
MGSTLEQCCPALGCTVDAWILATSGMCSWKALVIGEQVCYCFVLLEQNTLHCGSDDTVQMITTVHSIVHSNDEWRLKRWSPQFGSCQCQCRRLAPNSWQKILFNSHDHKNVITMVLTMGKHDHTCSNLILTSPSMTHCALLQQHAEPRYRAESIFLLLMCIKCRWHHQGYSTKF